MMNQERQQPVEHKKIDNNCKKIVIIGRSGNGKSSLTAHLGGKFKDPVQSPCDASCATIYISDQYELNIIDAQSLESAKTEQDLMKEIRFKNTCFINSTIHAIIILWSPLKGGHSALLKTITALDESLRENAIKYCIFMSQGNSETLAKTHQIDDSKKAAIEEENNKIKEIYPNVPLETYDTTQDANILNKRLKELMEKIEPFQVDEQQEIQLEERAQADELRLQRVEEEEKKEEVEVIQPIVQEGENRIAQENRALQEENRIIEEENRAIQEENRPVEGENRAIQEEENKIAQEENRALQEENRIIEEENRPGEEENRAIHEEENRASQSENRAIQAGNRAPANSIIGSAAKFGFVLAVSGAAVGMAAIAYEQSIVLAAGTVGLTAGAVSLTVAAAAGTFKGLSWAVQRARGVRA